MTQIKILLICNWCSSYELCQLWNKQSQDNNYSWNNISIVYQPPYDFVCIVNDIKCDINLNSIHPSKIIFFQMEPYINYSLSVLNTFLYNGSYIQNLNNIEWHLSKTYKQLINEPIDKNNELDHCLSTVLSNKYNDPYQKKRIDFMKFIEDKNILDVHFYGQNNNWKTYKGSLPYHCKDDALLPYKYTFNCENNKINNYCTEKLYDGILAECLVFYCGCPNISQYIDNRAYIQLELDDFEQDFVSIYNYIQNNEWHNRIKYIRAEKTKILNQLQFFPKLHSICNL